jgi:hypothetical protein
MSAGQAAFRKYVEEQATELAAVAQRLNMPLLAYFLQMAGREAKRY